MSQVLYAEASKMLLACQSLDYRKIIEHDSDEIAKLRSTLHDLDIRGVSKVVEGKDSVAAKPGTLKKADSGKSGEGIDTASNVNADLRKEHIYKTLADEGLEERTDHVYSSFVKGRSLPSNQVPHRIGLPEYDAVIAPDFAPNPGLHGIFITASEVISITLPIEEGVERDEWIIETRKEYANDKQLIDYVMLMSAGFELPE